MATGTVFIELRSDALPDLEEILGRTILPSETTAQDDGMKIIKVRVEEGQKFLEACETATIWIRPEGAWKPRPKNAEVATESGSGKELVGPADC